MIVIKVMIKWVLVFSMDNCIGLINCYFYKKKMKILEVW